jgi:uncharacterized protein YjbI with pentapeptide repeats
MASKFGIWWQKMKQHPVRLAIIIEAGVLVTALIVVIVLGYWFNWPWVGVNGGYSKITTTPQGTNTEYSPGKTLWNWLELLGVLAIPVVVGFGAAWFTSRQNQANEANRAQQQRENEANRERRHQTELEIAEKNRERQQQTALQIAADNQREAALQAYLDKMSEYLHQASVRAEISFEFDIQKMGRTRTLILLRTLDAKRKGSVLQFLYENGLIKDRRAISTAMYLNGADLTKIKLMGVNLSGATLSEADLSNANLSDADLSRANLSDADISRANLSDADLRGAHLRGATLDTTILKGAQYNTKEILVKDLQGKILEAMPPTTWPQGFNPKAAEATEENTLFGADLSHVDLSYVNLRGANLSYANLSRGHLSKADLSNAHLSGATLSEADLRNANLSDTTLSGATLRFTNLSGATLSRATLIDANLSSANLSEANLSDANLFGAHLSNAHLSNAP